ncbi:MAG: hypothetical protein N2169_04460 [bacterium]|nr:hypothetical protein [bacterium]
MFKYVSERYTNIFKKVLKLSNLQIDISKNKDLSFINRESKPQIVLVNFKNRKLIINTQNLCPRVIRFYILKNKIKNQIQKKLFKMQNTYES